MDHHTSAILSAGGQCFYDDKGQVAGVILSEQCTNATLAHVRAFKWLQELSLDNSRISADAFRGLESTTLNRLVLSGETITSSFLDGIERFVSLSGLTVRSPQVTDRTLALACQASTLKFLNISNSRVTDRCVEHISTLHDLEELWLSGCRLTDAGIKMLVPMPRLRILLINKTEVTDKGVALLSKLDTLEMLRIDDTNIEGHFASEFADCHLKELDISGTRATDEAIRQLCRIRSLTSLEVSSSRRLIAHEVRLRFLSVMRPLILALEAEHADLRLEDAENQPIVTVNVAKCTFSEPTCLSLLTLCRSVPTKVVIEITRPLPVFVAKQIASIPTVSVVSVP